MLHLDAQLLRELLPMQRVLATALALSHVALFDIMIANACQEGLQFG